MNAQGSSSSLREQVVALSHALGFDICRFAHADAPEHAGAFRDWLDQGAGGEMTYLSRNAEKRCDPQRVLPRAKSVIVLALNYFQGHRAGENRGRIARYAWGEDYHQVIGTKLSALDQFLRKSGGVQKCYVDTGPILERDHAASAGVGWHGKSTMLLNRDLGTWFFLAEILTTLEFAADRSQPDRCGTCTRCIEACPTGAITAPHRVDARRCISYLTIELKDSILPGGVLKFSSSDSPEFRGRWRSKCRASSLLCVYAIISRSMRKNFGRCFANRQLNERSGADYCETSALLWAMWVAPTIYRLWRKRRPMTNR